MIQPINIAERYHSNIGNANAPVQEHSPQRAWNVRAIHFLDGIEKKIDTILPNFFFQQKIDDLAGFIKSKFSKLTTFNHWISSNGNGAWYKQLAVSLCKLPLRVARNFVLLLFNIVKIALQTVVHPAKAVVKLAKLIVNLVHEITLPETWSKMGAGIVGAGVGQGIITGNPISVIAMGIGGAMIIAGLTFGALKGAILAERGHRLEGVGHELFKQALQLPESFLVGMCLGMLMGAVQVKIENYGKSIYNETIIERVNLRLRHFHLPPSSDIIVDPNGAVIIKWPAESLQIHATIKPVQQMITIQGDQIVMTIPPEIAKIPPFVLPDPLPTIFENAPLSAPILPFTGEILNAERQA